MNVVNLHVMRGRVHLPLLILIDPQIVYVEGARPFGLQTHAQAVANCRRALTHARKSNIAVAFLRWERLHSFMPSTRRAATSWISGLEPVGSDMIFDRSMPSAYNCNAFAELMQKGWGRNAAVAGFTGAISCLATIIDGSQRQDCVSFLFDASQSHAIDPHTEDEAHAMATHIISLFGSVETTDAWIQRTSRGNFGQGASGEADVRT